ncbi:MAG TPA: aspartate kinase [Erysipelotrichaceae bacterium]|nr:aspartate kinase [Erysipelotrichaceae bacterium]
MIKVVKFGGSSVANSKQFRKVKKIIKADPDRKFIVSSACGKESGEDHKVTDLLYLTDAHVRYGVSYEPVFKLIEDKYYSIRDSLKLKTDLETEFKTIRAAMARGVSQDYLVSRGEYLTSRLLAEYLDADFVDAADVISFRYDGSIDMERTQALINEKCTGTRKVVIPGFYGSLPNGVIRLMSRGGSDITGSVIANCVDADVYENWTDVSGFLVADPRIIKNPRQIPRITYNELREMSYMGANVLHDDAVFPVRSKNIPINIRNTNDPDNPGTMIMNDCSEMDAIEPPTSVTGITGRKNFTVITVVKSHASAEVGFLRKLLAVFEDYHVSIESVPVTVDTFSIIVKTEAVEQCLYEIIARIRKEFEPDDLRLEDHMAMLAVVGRGMKAVPGASGRFLSEFGRNSINIKVINQSADELSVVVGVENRDFEKAIKCIYDKFVAEGK